MSELSQSTTTSGNDEWSVEDGDILNEAPVPEAPAPRRSTGRTRTARITKTTKRPKKLASAPERDEASADDEADEADEAPKKARKPKKRATKAKAASDKSTPRKRSAPKDKPAPEPPTSKADGGLDMTEIGALCTLLGGLLLFLALVSFSPTGANWVGRAGHLLSDSLLYLFGGSSFMFVILIGFWGTALLRGRTLFERYGEGIGVTLILLSSSSLAHVVREAPILSHDAGGVVGIALGQGVTDLTGSVGGVLVLLLMLVIGGMLLTERSFVATLQQLQRWLSAQLSGATAPQLATANGADVEQDDPAPAEPGPSLRERVTGAFGALSGAGRSGRLRTQTGSIVVGEVGELQQSDPLPAGEDPPWVADLSLGDEDDGPTITARHRLSAARPAETEPQFGTEKERDAATSPRPAPVAPQDDARPQTEAAARPQFAEEIGPVIVESEAQRNRKRAEELDRAQQQRLELGERLAWEFPPLSFLDYREDQGTKVDREKLRALAAQLEQTLADFKVVGKVTGICPGPVVTLFEFQPASGTKLSKISSLSDDIAMSLKAHKVRIIAPIPGKGCVGIEVPNDDREIVFLKEIIADDAFTGSKSKLTLALGKDIEGYPVSMDLAKSPHLLIAGTTGSGKSVAVNAMITSLLYNATPDEVKLILIDPKQLEFAIYEGIPHLLLPVVTDPSKAATALHWAVQEMERRYKLMADMRVRNLHGYNEKLAKLQEKYQDYDGTPDPQAELLTAMDADGRPTHRSMFQLVVIVDEFADLMMVAGKEVEVSVARLAQKARAAGIHVILATQRPSVDVITGLIKANFPTRVSFRLMSGTDSRTVLDTTGAENLLGMGDMLYRPPGSSELSRVHGAYVDESEIEQIVQFVNRQRQPDFDESILEATSDQAEGGGSDEPVDELYDEAIAVVTEAGFASISMIQRKLRVGYNRSARIVDQMERDGIVGKSSGGSSRREVLAPPPPSL